MGNFILIALIAGIFLCCLYALHDMQTAEGVGLYFAMQLGLEQRLPMDILVDVVSMAVLAGLLYLPCRLLKHGTAAAYLRLLIGYLAVVPSLSLARILALFQTEQRVFLWKAGIVSSLETLVYSVAPFLQVWIPLLLLLSGIAKINCGYGLSKWHKQLLVLQAVLLLGILFLPSAENLLVYLIGYTGLLIAFDCWETLLEKEPGLRKWYPTVFGLLLLRGIYRMVVLMSQF